MWLVNRKDLSFHRKEDLLFILKIFLYSLSGGNFALVKDLHSPSVRVTIPVTITAVGGGSA